MALETVEPKPHTETDMEITDIKELDECRTALEARKEALHKTIREAEASLKFVQENNGTNNEISLQRLKVEAATLKINRIDNILARFPRQ